MEFFDSIFSYFDDLNKRQEELDIIDAARKRGPNGGPTDAVGNTKITIPEWIAGLRSSEDASKIGDQVTADNLTVKINEVKKENPSLNLTPNISKKTDESNLDFARRKLSEQSKNLKIAELKNENPDIDYSGVKKPTIEAFQEHTDTQREIKNAIRQGYDVTGVKDLAGLHLVKEDQDIESAARKTRGSVTFQENVKIRKAGEVNAQRLADIATARLGLEKLQIEQNAERAKSNQNLQALTTKMQFESAAADREMRERQMKSDADYRNLILQRETARDKRSEELANMNMLFQIIQGGMQAIQ